MKILNVLIVEDNDSDAELLSKLLGASSIEMSVKRVEALFEVKEAVENQRPDIVLLDIHLPDSSGLHTVEEAIDRCSQIPIIVMSGRSDSILSHQVIKLGAQDCIIKGQLDEELLTRSIRHSLERSTHLATLQKLNASLAKREAELLAAQEIAQLGMWSLDIVSQEMTWSPIACRLLGFDEPPFRPRFSDFNEYVHPEDIDGLYDAVAEAQRTGSSVMSEFRMNKNPDDIRHIISYLQLSISELDSSVVLTGVLQDVTERNLSQKLLVERQLQEQVNLVKNELLSDMGFVVRTPLSSAVNLVHVLESTPLNQEQEDIVHNLQTSIDEVASGVYNVLNFSLYSASELELHSEEFHLLEFLKSMQRSMNARLSNENKQLLFTIDSEVPDLIESDPLKLNQLIFNLVELYAELGNEEEHIDLRVEMVTQSQVKQKGTLRVIASSKAVKLKEGEFEILSSGQLDINQEPSRTIVFATNLKKLIDALGGYMNVICRPRKGASHTIDIPIDICLEKSVNIDKPNAPLSILLVEDHFLNQMATKGLLEKWSDHVKVDVAANGQIGLNKALSQSYDVILMDLQMPVMDGWDATEKILEVQPDQKIIALSAHSSIDDEVKSRQLGMTSYIVKPFKPQELYYNVMNTILAEGVS